MNNGPIAIIDYGMGNLRSVQKALEVSGADARITQDKAQIAGAAKVVLPGVGAIKAAVDKLKELALIDVINDVIAAGKPFLGICLGQQLLFERSDEGGQVQGLGILKGTVKRFAELKVPQIGWNQLHLAKADNPLFKGIPEGANVYFCHSYYVAPQDQAVVAATTDYGTTYASSIWKDNIFGVQFHPEKSQTVGLRLLKNFTELKA